MKVSIETFPITLKRTLHNHCYPCRTTDWVKQYRVPRPYRWRKTAERDDRVMRTCRQVAERLVGQGKGILAADESIGTMSTRLSDAGVDPTEENRRAYRELLATAPGLSEGVSGIIFCDETLGQQFSDGTPFPQAVAALGILSGIKVATGAKPCPGLPGEKVTEGVDGLSGRLAHYAEMGAAFAKWRADIGVHTLRHSAAVAWLESGVHIKAVADLLGHSSVAITGDIYGHTSDNTARAAVEGLAGRLGLLD